MGSSKYKRRVNFFDAVYLCCQTLRGWFLGVLPLLERKLPPRLTRTKGWRQEDVTEYERIKAQADEVFYTAQQYTRGCMHKRNRYIVDHSGICVCYLAKDGGGTAYTVNHAKKQGLNVFNIAANSPL